MTAAFTWRTSSSSRVDIGETSDVSPDVFGRRSFRSKTIRTRVYWVCTHGYWPISQFTMGSMPARESPDLRFWIPPSTSTTLKERFEMIKFYPTVKALFVISFMLVVASAAQAQATRTWVSGVGDDLNPCSRTAPCKTFAGAISKTAKDGEISVLDPGGYGAVTITKSIYINGTHGAGYGSIIASLVNGIIINITDAADEIGRAHV